MCKCVRFGSNVYKFLYAHDSTHEMLHTIESKCNTEQSTATYIYKQRTTDTQLNVVSASLPLPLLYSELGKKFLHFRRGDSYKLYYYFYLFFLCVFSLYFWFLFGLSTVLYGSHARKWIALIALQITLDCTHTEVYAH